MAEAHVEEGQRPDKDRRDFLYIATSAAAGIGAAVGPASLVWVGGASMVLAQADRSSNAEAIATTSNVTELGLLI